MEENNNSITISKETKIGVLCGGFSNEREVSLRSGKNVYKALLELGYKNAVLIDVDNNIAQVLKEKEIEAVYNVMHGRFGEDGRIQGVLEFLKIPYTGSGVKSSAICMDKEITKTVLKNAGIRVIKSKCLYGDEDIDKLMQDLSFPIMVKPASEGSSIGMSKADNREELIKAVETAKKADSKILLEEYLQGISCTVGVLEKDKQIFATPILEFRTKTLWYDYEAKYTKGLTDFILPAGFDKDLTKEIQDLAIKAHKICECDGVSRVDFLVYNNIPYILEINTSPGMTDLSDLPAQAGHMGINYNELVDMILKTSKIGK